MSSFLLIVLILLASSWSYKISSKSYQLLKHGKCNLKTDDRDIPRTSPITFQEIQTIAQLQGLKLVSSGLGPYLRLEAYSLEENEKIGYLTAFLRPLPLRLLHLETIQVKNRRQNMGYRRKGWKRMSEGISLLMGIWALQWAREAGCDRAQLLAVKDSETMNKILVRLYERFGFKVIREVEDSLLDRMTWGAEGTLMELNINDFFELWTPKFRNLAENFE